jgi:hypothetical protein
MKSLKNILSQLVVYDHHLIRNSCMYYLHDSWDPLDGQPT